MAAMGQPGSLRHKLNANGKKKPKKERKRKRKVAHRPSSSGAPALPAALRY